MNHRLKRAAAESRKKGYAAVLIALIFFAAAVACLFLQDAWIYIAFAVAATFCGFVSQTMFWDAQELEDLSDQ